MVIEKYGFKKRFKRCKRKHRNAQVSVTSYQLALFDLICHAQISVNCTIYVCRVYVIKFTCKMYIMFDLCIKQDAYV